MAGNPKQVLIVDDDALVRECIGGILETVGYQVRTAATVGEAMAVVHQHEFDLVILDIHLSKGADGLDCCRAIRAFGHLQRLPIVMMTGDGSRDTVMAAAQAGANGYVLKTSLDVTDLLGRLDRAVTAAAAAPEPVVAKPVAAPALASAPVPVFPSMRATPGTAVKPAPEAVTAPKSAPLPVTPTLPPAPPPSSDRARARATEHRLARLTDLAALPFTAAELVSATQMGGTTVADLGTVASRDPALALRFLRTGNVGRTAGKDAFCTLDRAAQAISFAAIRDLAPGVRKIENLYQLPECLEVLGLWQHSLACASLARELVSRGGGREDAEIAFVAGLLHDVGRAAFWEVSAADSDACRQAVRDGVSLGTVERDRFGLDHAEAAAKLLADWKLPPVFVETAELHHASWSRLKSRTLTNLRISAAVWIAERLLRSQAIGAPDDFLLEEIPDDAAELFSLDTAVVTDAITRLHYDLDDLCGVMLLHLPDGESPPSIATELPPAEPTRHALWLRTLNVRVDPIDIYLQRLGFAVHSGAWAPSLKGKTPSLVLATVASTEECSQRLAALRQGLADLGDPKARGVLLGPAASLPGRRISEDGPILLLPRPARISALAAWVGA